MYVKVTLKTGCALTLTFPRAVLKPVTTTTSSGFRVLILFTDCRHAVYSFVMWREARACRATNHSSIRLQVWRETEHNNKIALRPAAWTWTDKCQVSPLTTQREKKKKTFRARLPEPEPNGVTWGRLGDTNKAGQLFWDSRWPLLLFSRRHRLQRLQTLELPYQKAIFK